MVGDNVGLIVELLGCDMLDNVVGLGVGPDVTLFVGEEEGYTVCGTVGL